MLTLSLLSFAGIATADRIVYQNEEVACSKSKLLTRIDITDEMSFSMDIQVNKIPVGHSNYWESIFHCGASNYPRLPSIFMHPDADNEGRKFQGFVMTIDGDKNVASPVVHSGETHRLEVTYTQSSLVYKMNGEVFYNNQQYKGHKTPSNQPCYAGNPWYNSAKAVIHNLVIRDLTTGADGFDISYVPSSLESDKWINKGVDVGNDITAFKYGKVEQIPYGDYGSVDALCFPKAGQKGVTSGDLFITTVDFDVNSRANPELTMELWVYPRSLGTRTWALGNDDGGYDRAIMLSDSRFGGIAAGVGYSYKSKIAKPALNEWTQVVVVYSKRSGTVKVYKNGGDDGMEEKKIGSDSGSSMKLGLNGIIRHRDHNFHGCVGKVQIVARALSDNEVSELFRDGLTQHSVLLADNLVNTEKKLVAKISSNAGKIAKNTNNLNDAIVRIAALERKMKDIGKAASSAQSVGAMPEDGFSGYELADANKNLLVYCLVIFNIGTILGCISCLYWNQKAPAKGYKSVIPQYEDEDVKEALA